MKYDKEKYKIWDWKSPVILHWIINPGLAINELFLGLNTPKVTLIERAGEKPFYQRSFIPCPHCGEMHSGLKYSGRNKTILWNWFGFYCDNCGGIIPVQRNLTSLIILAVTFPVWGWFRKSLKQKWLEKQPERYKNLNLEVVEIPKKKGVKIRLKWVLFYALFMFVSMHIVFPLIDGKEITQKSILLGIPLWLIGGFCSELTMNWWMNKKCRQHT